MVSVAVRDAESPRALLVGHPGHAEVLRREGSIGLTTVHAHAPAMRVAIQNCQSPTGKLMRHLRRSGTR